MAAAAATGPRSLTLPPTGGRRPKPAKLVLQPRLRAVVEDKLRYA
jgi:hypothetical protein